MRARFRFEALVAGGLALFALSLPANALTVTIVSQDYTDFTVATLPADTPQITPTFTTGTFEQDVMGSVLSGPGSHYRSPFENFTSPGTGVLGWNSVRYDSVEAGASAWFQVAPSLSMSMLWGSPNSYNTIKLCTSNSLSTCGLAAWVPTVTPTTYGHNEIVFNSDTVFTWIYMTTGQDALEFANLTVSPNHASLTPIPAALPLFASGLGGLGLISWRRKRKKAKVIA